MFLFVTPGSPHISNEQQLPSAILSGAETESESDTDIVTGSNDEESTSAADGDGSPAQIHAETEENTSLSLTEDTPRAVVESDTTTEETLGRGHRTKKTNIKLRDYVVDTIPGSSPSSSHASISSSPQPSSGTVYPIENYVSCACFSANHQKFLTALSTNIEPKSFQEATKDPRWGNAVHVEYDSLEDNHTWRLENLPKKKKAFGCRWVFTIKYQADGTIERCKAKLVVFSNHQKEGLDYEETFAPVAKMKTVRLFFGFCCQEQP